MYTLKAKIRKVTGKRTKSLKKAGLIPAVVYGNGIKNVSIEVEYEEFRKVLLAAGESSLISLKIEGETKERPVLVHDMRKDYVTDKFIHLDFYQAALDQEVEVSVPLIFEGVSLAIKDLGGTLVKEAQEIKVKALPQNLPHDIKIDISVLNTFDDEIKVKDLKVPAGVKIMRGAEEMVAKVVAPAKVEEDLEKPIEEKVDDVEKVEKEKKVKEEDGGEGATPQPEKKPAGEKK